MKSHPERARMHFTITPLSEPSPQAYVYDETLGEKNEERPGPSRQTGRKKIGKSGKKWKIQNRGKPILYLTLYLQILNFPQN